MSRILIADDEAVEIKALEMMIHLDFPEEEVLPGAANGLEMIAGIEKERPDLVIADIRMPGMNGLDALELIRNRYPDMKIIITTAYSDFDYIKRALQMGASDYILKPVSRKTFSQTLGKVLSQVGQEKEKAASEEDIRENLEKMSRIAGEEFLSSLLLGEPSRGSFETYLKSLEGTYEGTIPLTIRFMQLKEPVEAGFYRETEEKSLQTLKKFTRCIGKKYRNELYLLIFPNTVLDEDKMNRWLRDIAGMVLSALEESYREYVSFGFGLPAREVDEIALGLEQSRIAARSHARGGVWFYREKPAAQEEDPFKEAFSQMIPLLKSGRSQEAAALLDRAFETEQAQAVSLDSIKMYLLENMAFAGEALAQEYAGLEVMLRKSEWEEFAAGLSIRQIRDWAQRVLLRMADLVRKPVQTGGYVEQALLYMQQYYAEDLSLDKVAERAGVSSFYLSRLFKQELGCTFVEALTQIRLDHALRMLRNGKATVKEVARSAGYRNTTYFYKVVKRYTGISVGQLRGFQEQPENLS